MCWSTMHCCSQKQFCEDFDCTVEETKEGVTIKIQAKDPKKLEAFKKMLAAHRELCGKAPS